MQHISRKLLKRLLALRWWQYILVSLVLGALVFTIVEVNTAYARDLLSLSVYGTKPHRIPCSKWPTPDEVKQVIDRHAQVVRRIESVNPGGILLSINTKRCPGRAEIEIYYPASRHREAIKRIIGDEKFFFDVPYTLINW